MAEPVVQKLRWGSALISTQLGPNKEANEDVTALLSVGGSDVLVVADGAGGMPSAQKAAHLSVAALKRCVDQAVEHGKSVRDGIVDGFEKANQAVLDLKVGAGSTLLVVEVQKLLMRTFNVGDSMAIAVGQKGRLKIYTHTHSPAGHAVAAGLIDHDEAFQYEDKCTVTNLVGMQAMKLDMTPQQILSVKDTVVVASDGLWDNVELSTVIEIVRKDSLEVVAASLNHLCGENMTRKEAPVGKPDDVSFIIYRFDG